MSSFSKKSAITLGSPASNQSYSTKPTERLPTICPNVILNDDLVYVILTVASTMVGTERQRREWLFGTSLVCQVWKRASQSLLFRHVFLQIRPAMLALLEIISHKTERRRRLAGYIRSAEVRLSRAPEPSDPPTLPMIHPRHLPALICHMPNLRELDLTTGREIISPEILGALARGPSIRALTLRDKKESVGHPVLTMLNSNVNPWPHLESVHIRHPDRIDVDNYADNTNAPRIALSELTVQYLTAGSFDEVPWLTRYSKGSISHVTLLSGMADASYHCLSHANLKDIRSLSLGKLIWTDDILKMLHEFNDLRELRFLSPIRLMRDFPSNLPDTIEHLVLTRSFTRPMGLLPVPKMEFTRPALLRTCKVLRHSGNRSLADLADRCSWIDTNSWVEQYVNACLHDGVYAEVTSMAGETCDPPSSMVKMGLQTATARTREFFEPTETQLDTTDFDLIVGRNLRYVYTPMPQYRPTPVKIEPRTPVPIIRGLVSWWQSR